MTQDSKGLNNDVHQIMARQWDRRQLLGYGAGGTAALLLAGCGGSSGDSSTSSTVASSGTAAGYLPNGVCQCQWLYQQSKQFVSHQPEY